MREMMATVFRPSRWPVEAFAPSYWVKERERFAMARISVVWLPGRRLPLMPG